jgi:hypothetical protein
LGFKMEKSTAAILLALGIFLLYVGMFGSAGFTGFSGANLQPFTLTSGFTDSLGSIDNSRWNTLTAYGDVSAGFGQLRITSPGGALYEGGALCTVTSYDVAEANIKLDVLTNNYGTPALFVSEAPITQLGQSTTNAYALAVLDEGQGAPRMLLVQRFHSSGAVENLLNPIVVPPATTGVMNISIHSGTVKFYWNDIVEYTAPWDLSTSCYIALQAISPTRNSMTVAFANFVLSIQSSQPSPSPSGSPGPSPSPGTSPTPSSSPNPIFSGGDPITALVNWVMHEIDVSAVRTFMFMVGILLAAVGGIVLLMPGKQSVVVAR